MTIQTSPIQSDLLHRAQQLVAQFGEWGAATHATAGFPQREMDALRDAGLFGVTLPGAELDGSQPNTARLLQLLKLIGKGNLSVGRIYEGHINAIELIRLYATPEQQTRWYAEARAGHLFGVWNTEMHDGLHLDDQEDGRVRVRGCKSFCSGSIYVTRPVITGVRHRPDGEAYGWQMLIPHLNEHDLPVDESFWTPLGMQNSVSHKIDFSGLSVTEDQLLGKPDDYETQPHFTGGAIRFAAVHLGGAEALLDATRSFLQKVRRTEDCHQRTRIGQMAIHVESGNQWIDRAGRINDHSDSHEQIMTTANMTRTAIADGCIACLQLAERSVGSRGLMHPGALARLHTDLSMYLRQPAPDATLELVGKHYLTSNATSHSLAGRHYD